MSIFRRCLILCIGLLAVSGCTMLFPGYKADKKPIKLLIMSGKNNHDWKKTTPALKKIYEESGRFTVEVANDVKSLTAENFDKYDVIVCNYTTWPKIKGERWPKNTEKEFLKYIKEGHGFVLFHAASTAWNDWPEFGELIGMKWKKGYTSHGYQHSFTIKISDINHPVTKGMKDFQHVKDEMYAKQIKSDIAQVLATAYSAKKQKGSGLVEPMIVITEYGKGRVFHNALGHCVYGMSGAGFKTLMLRGTEWAATGKVTLPIPADLPEPKKIKK